MSTSAALDYLKDRMWMYYVDDVKSNDTYGQRVYSCRHCGGEKEERHEEGCNMLAALADVKGMIEYISSLESDIAEMEENESSMGYRNNRY